MTGDEARSDPRIAELVSRTGYAGYFDLAERYPDRLDHLLHPNGTGRQEPDRPGQSGATVAGCCGDKTAAEFFT